MSCLNDNEKLYYLMCKDKELIKVRIVNDMISNIEILNYNSLPEMLKINNSIALQAVT